MEKNLIRTLNQIQKKVEHIPTKLSRYDVFIYSNTYTIYDANIQAVQVERL